MTLSNDLRHVARLEDKLFRLNVELTEALGYTSQMESLDASAAHLMICAAMKTVGTMAAGLGDLKAALEGAKQPDPIQEPARTFLNLISGGLN